MRTLKNLNRRKREGSDEVKELKKTKVDKGEYPQPRQIWEFENYIKERLMSQGIIQ